MTSEQLRSTRDAVPFQPFVIHMTNGRSYRIPHRDYLHIFPNGRVASVARVDVEALELIDVMLIVSLALEDAPTSPPSNNGE